MRAYHYHLVNVFAHTHFGGNPLAVFPDADDLTECEMQQIAQQFNLSETVFVKKSEIFTPECFLNKTDRYGKTAAQALPPLI